MHLPEQEIPLGTDTITHMQCWLQRLPFIMSALLCGFILFHHQQTTVNDAASTEHNESPEKRNSIVSSVEAVGHSSKTLDPETVIAWHLFGVRDQQNMDTSPAMQAVTDYAALPVTRLNLKVTGVFAHADNGLGHAIITNSQGESSSYRVGDAIEGNVMLHAIHGRYVVVNNNLKLEKLALPELTLDSAHQHQSAHAKVRQYAGRNVDPRTQ